LEVKGEFSGLEVSVLSKCEYKVGPSEGYAMAVA
jgi:hypothetical protein